MAIKKKVSVKTNSSKMKQQNVSTWISVTVLIIIALFVVFTIGYSICKNNAVFDRMTSVVKTDHYKVSKTMMTFLSKSEYQNFVSQYSDYLQSYGLSTDTPLDEQTTTDSEGNEITWEQYFINTAKTNAETTLRYCEGAKENGLKLDDDDYNSIDDYIEYLEGIAKQYSFSSLSSFLNSNYGSGLKEVDIRNCYKQQLLATKYSEFLQESLENTDEEVTDYFNENVKKFSYTDYLFYAFAANVADDATDEDAAAAAATAKADAEKLNAATTPEEFKSLLTEYLTAKYTTEAEAAAAAGTEQTSTVEEQVATALTAAEKVGYTYTEGDELSEWAFADDASVNSVKMIEDESTSTYTVYMLTKTIYHHDYITQNVRHILFYVDTSSTDTESASTQQGMYTTKEAAMSAAEAVMAEWAALPEAERTEDKFAELADAKSYDVNAEGGLYEDVKKGDMVEAFENWLYSDERKAGDVDIVESTYGYHIMYYVGTGREAWMVETDTGKQSDDYTAATDKLKNDYPISTNDKALGKIAIISGNGSSSASTAA